MVPLRCERGLIQADLIETEQLPGRKQTLFEHFSGRGIHGGNSRFTFLGIYGKECIGG